MKIDISLWENKTRLQKRIRDLGKVVLSLSAVNIFNTISTKSWIILGINIMFFVTTLPVFISWAKYEKEPPKYEDKR